MTDVVWQKKSVCACAFIHLIMTGRCHGYASAWIRREQLFCTCCQKILLSPFFFHLLSPSVLCGFWQEKRKEIIILKKLSKKTTGGEFVGCSVYTIFFPFSTCLIQYWDYSCSPCWLFGLIASSLIEHGQYLSFWIFIAFINLFHAVFNISCINVSRGCHIAHNLLIELIFWLSLVYSCCISVVLSSAGSRPGFLDSGRTAMWCARMCMCVCVCMSLSHPVGVFCLCECTVVGVKPVWPVLFPCSRYRQAHS